MPVGNVYRHSNNRILFPEQNVRAKCLYGCQFYSVDNEIFNILIRIFTHQEDRRWWDSIGPRPSQQHNSFQQA